MVLREFGGCQSGAWVRNAVGADPRESLGDSTSDAIVMAAAWVFFPVVALRSGEAFIAVAGTVILGLMALAGRNVQCPSSTGSAPLDLARLVRARPETSEVRLTMGTILGAMDKVQGAVYRKSPRGVSSARESAGIALQRSRVRIPYPPPTYRAR
jgi:hypothetical protein